VAEASEPADLATIDLKDPAMAALLAWLIPGLGHWYQGRWAKASLYFLCIMGLFSYGVYLSSSDQQCADGRAKIGYGRAVYFAWQKEDHHLAYLCQIGVGLPALPALVQAYRAIHHQRVWWHGFMAPPWPTEQARARAEDDARRAGGNDGNGLNFNVDQPTLDDLNRLLPSDFDIAGFFTMVAGLLNVLAIYDAWAGPVVVQAAEKKKEDDEEEAVVDG
jgi:hypothetical protein